ncbi:MAG: OmpP1/FadL family transporter [Bosea sp. (in: a-proteobacteria)]
MLRQKLFALAAVSAFSLAAASAAQASSFAIRSGQGAEGLGMAYAGAASGGIGLAGMAWNPAIITMFPGRTSNWNFTYILPNASYDVTRPATVNGVPVQGIPGALGGPGSQLGSGNIGGAGAFVPASATAWQLTDRFWVGLTNGAPWGLRSKADNQVYSGQTYGRSAKIRSVNVAPTFGYQINDWLSVGGALQVQYFKARLSQATSLAPTATPAILDGNDIGWGYRVGVNITPTKDTQIGIAYRSSIRHQLDGDFLGVNAAFPILPIRANLNLPDSVVVGLSHRINDTWQVHAGVEWTNWSKFRRIPIVNQLNQLPVSSLNFVYDDSWYFSGGVEYKASDALTLRAGVGYELSAVNDTNRTVFISDNDRLWLSGGMSYMVTPKLKVDLGYTYIHVANAKVDYNAVTHPQFRNVNVAYEAKPHIHIASVGITYRWDDPSIPQPAARAVVTKY